MKTDDDSTCFAPAERALPAEIIKDWAYFKGLPHLQEMLDAVPNIVMVLNRCRQTVFCNRLLLDHLRAEDEGALLGLRPGELLNCAHATGSKGRCGTTEFCRTCGAVSAILSSIHGKKDVKECQIMRSQEGRSEWLDLRVHATPLQTEIGSFTVFSIQDVSHERRRRMLERVFFHDVLNAAGALRGFVQLARDAESGQAEEYLNAISEACEHVLSEIRAQSGLLAAENNELSVQPTAVDLQGFLHSTAYMYARHEVGKGRRIVVDAQSATCGEIETDPTILGRIIGNMVKNALEASQPGESVTIGCRAVGDGALFSVHNPGCIPRDVQLQLFMRSVSTKGAGRGIGTYSIKLLTERYLKGNVWFSSSPDEGTTFFAAYPRKLTDSGAVLNRKGTKQ